MITAMQMMLNDLISKREVYENASMHESVATLETSIELAEYLLKLEKEQIMNAYSDGAKGGANGIKGQHKNGWVSINTKEKYYKLLQQTSK
jgi:hypothetical protein